MFEQYKGYTRIFETISASLIDQMSDLLFTKRLDKKLEFEADVYGAECLYRAGYNPRGLRDYLMTLKSQEGMTRKYNDTADFPFLTKRFRNRMKSG